MSILRLWFLLLLLLPSLIPSSFSQSCSEPASFPSNPTFSSYNDLLMLSSSLHWTFDASNVTLSFAFAIPRTAGTGEARWVSWAINHAGKGMLGAQPLIVYQKANNKMGVNMFNISDYAIKPSPIDYVIEDLTVDFVCGVMRIYGKVILPKWMSVVNQVWKVVAVVKDGIYVKHEFAPVNINLKRKLYFIHR